MRYNQSVVHNLIIPPELVMNLGGRKSASGTSHSVSQFVSKSTDLLLENATEQGFGAHKQEALKALMFKRDGNNYVLTMALFEPMNSRGVKPILAHVIPNSVHDKVTPATDAGREETLVCFCLTCRDLRWTFLEASSN